MHDMLMTGSHSRKFFVTRQGYMGAGPKDTEKGEQFVYLWAAKSHLPSIRSTLSLSKRKYNHEPLITGVPSKHSMGSQMKASRNLLRGLAVQERLGDAA